VLADLGEDTSDQYDHSWEQETSAVSDLAHRSPFPLCPKSCDSRTANSRQDIIPL
jgi:hypothetical protein